MISADTNIFVYAANRYSDRYEKARAFLGQHADNTDFVISELMLIELYMALRNKPIMTKPYTASQAVRHCRGLRENSSWQVVDLAPEIYDDMWKMAASEQFATRRIIDARLGLSLRFHGVTEFATVNTKDFTGCGFKKVWNPLSQPLPS